VKIPPGSAEGTTVRLAGQGGPGAQSGHAGDVFLEIHVRPHPLVRLEGRDLTFDLPVTVSEAMLGAEVRIPTFEGDLKLKIPKGSQSGHKLRLRGKGLPDRQGGRGDLHAVLQVVLPEAHGAHEAQAHKLAQEMDPLYKGDVREKLRL
jgi:DnaJ-class molecular chaperone